MWEPVVADWVSLIVRWIHLITGIAWIGASFYFIHLDASLRRSGGLPAGVGGEAWQVHGGGFYRMQKYLVAPAELPEHLTWFKYEAYSTWLSGFVLLGLIYYLSADLYLIDPAVMDLPVWGAILISVVSLALGWVIYDRLCRSPAGRQYRTAVRARLCFPGRRHLGLHAGVLRPRRLHPRRRADRHDHGRERVLRDHPESEDRDRRPDRGPPARSGARRAGRAALAAQQLPDFAGPVPDDQQSPSAQLRDALELADRRARAHHRRGDPPFLQRAPRGQAEPVVDLGRGGRRDGRWSSG